jgi:hypothetical protein
MAPSTSQARFLAFFSEGQISSPVAAPPLGECNVITNRRFGESDSTLAAAWKIETEIRSIQRVYDIYLQIAQ